MAERGFDAPETTDTGGGNFLRDPGTYHLICTSVEDPATNKDGGVLGGFRANFQVLAGSTPGQRDKTCDVIFWDPKLTDKNEGLFARQRQAAFYIATGIIKPQDLGKSGLTIDPEKAKGRQCVATFEIEDKFIRLHFCDLWHVDDPAAAKFPKDEKSLAMIPAALRLKDADFQLEAQEPVGAAAGSDDSDLDDI